jgi:predicted thioesterase
MNPVTLNGREVDFDACVQMMDEEIREGLHGRCVTNPQEFLDAYCLIHKYEHGKEFEI